MNKLHFTVRQYFPLHETLFSHFGKTIQIKLLLKYPTYKKLKSAKEEDIRAFMIENRFCRNDFLDRALKKIRDYEQCISDEVANAYKYETESLCRIIAVLADQIKSIDKRMTEITMDSNIGQCFKTIPGVGNTLASQLLSIFGDNKERFENYNGVQCLFGTAPKNYQSGLYHKVLMRKACNKNSRAILYHFAFSSLKYCLWARKYYDLQKSRGKTHSVAVRALSNKWVKILFRIWKDEIPYDEEKHDKINLTSS